MISKKMTDALCKQINMEMSSSYAYLAMSTCADEMGLPGTAKWFKVQAGEETGHAMRILDYLKDQRAPAKFEAIAKPSDDYPSLLALAEGALGHEQRVTKSIHALVALARAEKDPATEAFLQWFVTEQVEEEAHAAALIDRAKMAGDSGPTRFMLDQELGRREAD